MNSLSVISEDRLVGLARAVVAEHEAAMSYAANALERAKNAGVLLLEAKSILQHGDWLPWLAENVGIPERTAQAYMRVANNWPELKRNGVADLSLRGALKALSDPKPGWLLSESVDWYTPAPYVDAARQVMGGIDLDPASCEVANTTVCASRFYSEADNGLTKPWPGRVWLNPPYGGAAGAFVAHLLEQYGSGITASAVALLNANSVSTSWFSPLWVYPLCFTDHRISFLTPDGSTCVASPSSSVFVYLGDDESAFAREFRRFGHVVKEVGDTA